MSSIFPKITGPVLGWGKGVGVQFEMDMIKNSWKYVVYFHSVCYIAVLGWLLILKELYSPIRNGFIEGNEMILLSTTSEHESVAVMTIR